MRHARSSALLLALWACHRVSASAGDSGGPEQVALGAVGSAVSFSAPVAAARVRSGTTMVAGLLVSRGTVAVSDIGDDGLIRWTVDVLSGISGGPNVELHVFPARDGAAVVYRGRIDDRVVDFGKVLHRPNRQDLRLTLDAILRGDAIPNARTRCIGCLISSEGEKR